MKTCSTCKTEKTLDQFSWKVKDVRRSGMCKDCHRDYRRQHYIDNRQKYIDKARRWESENGGKISYKYNLSKEELDSLFSRFDGMCWLCRTKLAVVVDHDHSCCPKESSCGQCVRGVLCKGCNLGLGLLGDDIEGMKRAEEYLRYNKVQ